MATADVQITERKRCWLCKCFQDTRICHSSSVDVSCLISSFSSCNPRLTPWCWDQGSVGAKPSVAGLLVLLVAENSSLCLWLYVWGCCHAAEWIWNHSDTYLMVLRYGYESKHLKCLKLLHSTVYRGFFLEATNILTTTLQPPTTLHIMTKKYI